MDPTGSAVPPTDLEKSQPVEIQLLDGRYEILELLGQGGMGTVIKARHARLHKLVAIKVLNAGLLNDENRARFEVEAKAGSKLSHPNLVSVFDYGFTQGNEPYLVMEYVEGQSLDRAAVFCAEAVSASITGATNSGGRGRSKSTAFECS